MKKKLKSLIPEWLHEWHRHWRKRNRERRFFRQGLKTIQRGDYKIEAPENHPIIRLIKEQPYRDLCIGIVAKYVSAKYPDGTMVDIGANIGDTAAIIATHAKNKLVLVEASDYYFNILSRNASHIPNVYAVKKALVSDGSVLSGSLSHWGGTANFREAADAKTQTKSQLLSDVADLNTCFIKIDTDGFDFRILKSSIAWLSKVRPAIFLENWIRNKEDLADAGALYSELTRWGYTYFIVWDDQGFHLVSTTSLEVLKDLNRYLLKNAAHEGHKASSNYDVLCLHQKDEDVYRKIRNWYESY